MVDCAAAVIGRAPLRSNTRPQPEPGRSCSLYLHNMPPYTKMSIEPETARADSQLPLDYGLKDSSDDRDDFRAVRGGPHPLPAPPHRHGRQPGRPPHRPSVPVLPARPQPRRLAARLQQRRDGRALRPGEREPIRRSLVELSLLSEAVHKIISSKNNNLVAKNLRIRKRVIC